MASSPHGKRVVMTGGGGFVGTVLRRLLAQRHSDWTIVAPGLEGDALDVADRDHVFGLVEAVRPAAIVHLAAIAAPSDANAHPQRAWAVNFQGTLNIADAMRTYTPEARLVFAGSSEAYGDAFNLTHAPVKESAALLPRSVYGATKAAADVALGQMRFDGLDVVRFRPFNHTGPGQSDTYVASTFARQVAAIAHGQRVPIVDVGDLTPRRDFLDVRDVARAYAMAITAEEVTDTTNGVFNLASGNAIRIGAILDRLIALSGRHIEIRVDPARVRPATVPVASGDPSAALDTFGWKPVVAFEETIAQVYEYWLSRLADRPEG